MRSFEEIEEQENKLIVSRKAAKAGYVTPGTENGFADAELLQFTTKLYQRLPRELRDLVYNQLYDVIDIRDFLAMRNAINPEGQKLKAVDVGTNPSWPRFIKPGTVHAEFAEEAVQTFYEQYQGITILDAQNLDAFLHTGFFNLSTTLSASALSALSVCLHLTSNYDAQDTIWFSSMLPLHVNPHKSKYIDPTMIPTYFGPLIRPEQRLARGFKLTIVLYTEFIIYMGQPRPGLRINIGLDSIVDGIMSAIAGLSPVLVGLKKKCDAEVKLGICFGDMTKLVVKEEHMGLGAAQWMNLLMRIL